jgi:uncharacterized membrane protein YbaN (DUF454 family)
MSVSEGRIGDKSLKLIYNILGTISLIFAFIGVVLPVIPTTPFVLLSAACYYKGSERLHDWLTHNEVFGPIIRDYEKHGGMKKATKIKALAMMWTAVLASALFILNTLTMKALVLLIAIIGTVSMLRVKTIE